MDLNSWNRLEPRDKELIAYKIELPYPHDGMPHYRDFAMMIGRYNKEKKNVSNINVKSELDSSQLGQYPYTAVEVPFSEVYQRWREYSHLLGGG